MIDRDLLCQALALAEDWLQGYVSTWGFEDRDLAGWTKAIRALDTEHESRRFTQNGECGGEFCTSCDSIRQFYNAMLGKEKGNG